MRKAAFLCFILVYTFNSYGQRILPVSPINICVKNSVNLTVDFGGSNPLTFQWQKDGVDIKGANKSSYLASEAGDYTVYLDYGRPEERLLGPNKVILNDYPVADFKSDFVAGQCGNLPVQFNDQSTNGATYLWDFGDPRSGPDNKSVEKNPVHRFVGAGGILTEDFKISLTVSSAAGGCKTTTTQTITAKQSPDATLGGTGAKSFNGRPGFASCSNLDEEVFTIQNNSKTKATNTNYTIKWGDGSPDYTSATFDTPQNHKYDAGYYTIKYTVEGSNGCNITSDYYVFIGTNPTVALGGPTDASICAGKGLPFTISAVSGNSPGTQYALRFNDGTPAALYDQSNVPSLIQHSFPITSCGTTSGIYPNAFEGVIIASNPCNVQEASVRPIYVSQTPIVEFSASPSRNVCPNTTVTITNETLGNAPQDGKCVPGNAVWTVKNVSGPATGFQLISGDLGSDAGSNDVTKWVAGDNQLKILFKEVGTYKILLRSGNTSCGVGEFEDIICVTPPPIAKFKTNKTEVCTGVNVIATPTKNDLPVCGVISWKWDVTYAAPANCGEYISDFLFVKGDQFTERPTFKFNTPGTYTLKLTVSNGSCSAETTETVDVIGKPLAEINGVTDIICSGNILKPSVLINCFRDATTTFNWTFPGGSPATSDQENPGNVVFKTPGNQNITLKVNNACGETVLTNPVTVNSVPSITSSSAKNPDRCDEVNGTITLNGLPKNTIYRAAYLFNGAPDTLEVVSNNSGVAVLSNLAAGTYDKISIESNGCPSNKVGPFVLVEPPLAVPEFDISSTGGCGPVKVHFTNNTPNLAAFKYTWDFGNGITSNLANPVDVIFNESGTGRDTAYKVILSAGVPTCPQKETQTEVLIKSRPFPAFTPSSSEGCSPLKVTFSNVSRGITSKYTWDFGDGSPIVTTNDADQQQHVFTTTTGKVYPVQLIAENGCGKDTFKLDIKVAPNNINLNVSMNGPDHQGCVPHTVTLYNNSSGGSIFTWDFGDGFTQTSTNNQDSIKHTYITPGKYIINLTASNSCSEKKTTDYVNVNATPTAKFKSSRNKLCTNEEVNFTNQSEFADSYKWDFGDNTTSDLAEPTHQFKAPGFYRVVLTSFKTNGPGNACAQTTDQIIEISAPIVAVNADASNCTNVPVLFNSNIQSAESISNIVWTVSNGASGFGQTFDYTFITAGTYKVNLTATSAIGCVTTTTHDIVINASPVLKTSADVVICQGKSATLTVSGALQYQWTPSVDLSCSDCATPIASPKVSTPFRVVGTNGFQCTASQVLLVTVIEPLTITTSADESLCAGESVSLRVSGADSYIWTPAESLNDNKSDNPVASPKVTTAYKVTGYDAYNCFSSTSVIKVAVEELPVVELGPDVTLAAGTVYPLTTKTSVAQVVSYLWTPSDNLDCADCAVPNALVKKDVTYKVLVKTAFGCEASDVINIKVICKNTQVFIPNTFTPDGDGINDILMVRGSGIALVKSFRIFNRLGEVVFDKSNFAANEPAFGWDGKVRGKPGPSSVYVYTAEVICGNGDSFIYKGNVTILK